MHKFDIYLTDEIVLHEDDQSAIETFPGVKDFHGRIQIGDYTETFMTCLVSWDRNLYRRHWILALRRLLEGGTKSALITSYVEPALADYLIWWPLYRAGTTVYVQNQMLFYNQLLKPFSSENPWESVPERRTLNDEGSRISEWTTDVSSVQECLGRLRRGDRS
jgi:hypothetical protein